MLVSDDALNSTERTAADSTLFRTSNGTKSKNRIDCVPKELIQDNRNIKSDVEISFENVIEGIEMKIQRRKKRRILCAKKNLGRNV